MSAVLCAKSEVLHQPGAMQMSPKASDYKRQFQHQMYWAKNKTEKEMPFPNIFRGKILGKIISLCLLLLKPLTCLILGWGDERNQNNMRNGMMTFEPS